MRKKELPYDSSFFLLLVGLLILLIGFLLVLLILLVVLLIGLLVLVFHDQDLLL